MLLLSIHTEPSQVFKNFMSLNTDALLDAALNLIIIVAITFLVIKMGTFLARKIMVRVRGDKALDHEDSLSAIVNNIIKYGAIIVAAILIGDKVIGVNLMGNMSFSVLLGLLIEKAIILLVIIVATKMFIKVTTSAVKSVMIRQKGDGAEKSSMTVLFVNLIKYGTLFIAALMIIDNVFGIKTSALLATAGVASVALGFGAQSLVQDVITGIFILMENYYSVGDLITLDGHIGTVEYLGIRSTKIRTFNGDIYNIPNGQVKTVLNHARGDRNIYLDIPVAYEHTLEQVTQVLELAFSTAEQKIENLASTPQVLGISKFADSCMNIKITAVCKEGMQYATERDLLGLIKKTFDDNGIEIPYNKLVVLPAKE